MHINNLIEEKLFGYTDFLQYCKESGKKFVEELDGEDFIAYSAEYSVPHEQVEQIKKLLNFQEQNSTAGISVPQDISDELDETADSLMKIFSVDNLAPYENILISKLDFNSNVQNCLSVGGYKTLN